MSPFTRLYYTAKPFLPRALRNGLRRAHARRVRRHSAAVWPVLPGSERPPAGWPGWPDGKQFAVVLTHDVEGQSGYDQILRLAALEKELGFRSSFNLIPEGPYSVAPELRAKLQADGFEVGVHDLHHDGKLYRSREEFSRRAKRINRYIREWGAAGFRSAYMHHNLEWLGELDVAYDASTFDTDPFEPQPDGVGTIFPFWVPRSPSLSPSPSSSSSTHSALRTPHSALDPVADHHLPSTICHLPTTSSAGSALRPPSSDDSVLSPPSSVLRTNPSKEGFVELPYTLVQDSTLFLYLGDQNIDCWKWKVDWIARHGGMVLINVHPDYVGFGKIKNGQYGYGMYRDTLLYLKNRYAERFWNALPVEVADFHNQSSTVQRESEPTYHNIMQCRGVKSEQTRQLAGRRALVLLYSDYPTDPRPRRAAEALAASGMEVDVLCLEGDTNSPKCEFLNGVRLHRVRLAHRRAGVIRYLFQYAAFFLSSVAFVIRKGLLNACDLVHVHNMPDFLAIAALPARLRGAKIILDLHDPMPELYQAIFGFTDGHWMVRLLKDIERLSIRSADRVLTPNLAFKRIFEKRSCDGQKIKIIMNSPEESVFHENVKSAILPEPCTKGRPFRILHHGSIVDRHGLDIAVQAVAIARQYIPSIQFFICGRPTPYLDEVIALAESLDLTNVVRYLGRKTLPQIAEHIKACDVGVIPNRLSAFTAINMPTRIFEYLALGRPVIVPDTEGIRDYFGDTNMIFFRPNSSEDLAHQFVRVFEQPAEVTRFVDRGQLVYAEHKWSQQRSHFIDSTRELLSAQE